MARKAKSKKQEAAAEPWVYATHAQVVAWLRQVGRITVTNKNGTPLTFYTGTAHAGPNRGQAYFACNGNQRIYAQHWGDGKYLPEIQALAAEITINKVKPTATAGEQWLQARYGQPAPKQVPQVSTHEKRLIVAVRAIETALKALNG